MINLSDYEQRLELLASIRDENNMARKQVSLKQSEVAGGRLQQYVKERLRGELDLDSVREMPLVTSINVQRAVTDKKATIYKKKPLRRFSGLSEDQEEKIKAIYKDMKLDSKMNQMNKNYVFQDQSIGMIVPKNGKLICRVFKMHQIDAIPSLDDPETADGYILSTFDRTLYTQYDSDKKEYDTATGYRGRADRSTASQDKDLKVAEKYQFQKYVEKYVVWSKDYNFMMNGLGEVIDPETGEPSNEVDIESPLASQDIIPFFEIARDKDYEYFTRPANALTDFTVQFNSMLSDLANNIKMNGYAVGLLKAPSELQPENQIIGASMLLKLPTDDPDKEVDFEFISPNSNIGEISQAIDKFLNYFVTSEGVGGQVVNSTGEIEKAQSGIDRFLMMLSKVEAHSDDYDAFMCVEDEVFRIIKAWLNVLSGSNALNNKYKTVLPEDSEVHVDYHKPEMIETKTEMLTNIERMIDLGLMSKKQAIMELNNIDNEDEAKAILEDIKADEAIYAPIMPEPMQSDEYDEESEEYEVEE
jgi:hypothetical protein